MAVGSAAARTIGSQPNSGRNRTNLLGLTAPTMLVGGYAYATTRTFLASAVVLEGTMNSHLKSALGSLNRSTVETFTRPGRVLSESSRVSKYRMILAGFPTITTSSGKDFVTTAPAPTITRRPRVTPGRITAFAPIQHP